MRYLRQSTSQIVAVGPFVDVTDGFTPETGITLGAADSARIIKQSAGASVDIAANTWAHVIDGLYNLTLSASDTDTRGSLVVQIRDDSVCRLAAHEFTVLAAHVYDALVAYTAQLGVDVIAVSGSAPAADALEAGLSGVFNGEAQAASTTTVTNTDLTETADDHFNNRTLTWISGDLAGQSAVITDYNGTTKALSHAAFTAAPDAGDLFVIS